MTNKAAKRMKAVIELPACILQRCDLKEEHNRKFIIIIIPWLQYPRRIRASLDALLHTSMPSATSLQVTKSLFLVSLLSFLIETLKFYIQWVAGTFLGVKTFWL
jgi:hypothetical protein